MRNSTRIIVSALFATLLFCTSTSPAEQTRRDGNWWVARSGLDKSSYVLGMFDGIELGQFLVMRNIRSQADADKLNGALNEFMSNKQLLLSNVTVGQVQAGLDDFYQDYKNRKIYCNDAVQIVLEGSAGMGKDQLEFWVQKLREAASKY
jgi:hypothetical protein